MNDNFKKIYIKFKRNSISIIFLAFTILLVIFSKSNLTAAKDGLSLWASSVIPSLFPFFVATELLSYTNIVNVLGKVLNKYMRPIFNVPGEGAFAFIIGLISGYPVGAKAVCKLRENNLCSRSEGNRLLCFTNNSGPLFILGTIGVAFLKNSTIGLLLLITHILSSITVGIILGIIDRSSNSKTSINLNTYSINESKELIPCSLSNLGEIIGKSINNAISTTMMIGGFVVLFSVILSILKNSNVFNILHIFFNFLPFNQNLISGFFMGIIELTNGAKQVCMLNTKNITVNVIVCSFLLGFGGFSVLLQVFSIISKTDLSIKAYLKGKFLQGIIASFYTYIAIQIFPFLNYNL